MEIFNSKMEINRLPFSKMLKLEVPELAEEVIGVVKKNDPELMQIEPVFDLLVGKRPIIDSLMSRYGVDPVRLELKPLRENMVLCASAIKLRLRMQSKSHDMNDLHVIQTAVNRHLRYLYKSKNVMVLNQKISGFIDEADTNVELAEALEEFGFTFDINALKMALADVRIVSNKRSRLLSKRPELSTTLRMKIVFDAIEDVFKEIEVAQLRNPEIDYSALVRELNVVVHKYRLNISRRDFFNKRKAEEQNGNGYEGEETEGYGTSSAEDETSKEVQTTANGSNGYHPTQVYNTSITKMDNPSNGETSTIESDLDSEENIDAKKAVDSSWGTFQQPLSTDKA